MSEIYKMFATNGDFDFSEEAAEEMYLFETRGEGDLQFGLFSDRKPNGYAVGKRYMNVAIEMWKQDIRSGLLFRFELEEDFPKWFLDKFLGNVKQGWPLNSETTLNLYRSICVQEGESERQDE